VKQTVGDDFKFFNLYFIVGVLIVILLYNLLWVFIEHSFSESQPKKELIYV